MSAAITILRNWVEYTVPRSLEAVAQWLRENPGPEKKPEGDANAPNLVWLASLSENASRRGHPKYSDEKGFDLAFTHGAFFDVDGEAATAAAFSESLMALGRAGIGAAYSKSHNATDEDPYRGHVQLVFDAPCPAELHGKVWKQLHRELFPHVLGSQFSPNRGRNAPKPGATIDLLPGGLVNWRAVLERAPKDEPKSALSAIDLDAAGDRLRRALAYEPHIPPSIAGSGGDDALYRAACECKRFGLTEDEAMIVMRRFNDRCQPRWPESRLRYKIKSAYANKSIIFGEKLTEREPPRTRRVSVSPVERDYGPDPDSYGLDEPATNLGDAAERAAIEGEPSVGQPAPKETERAPVTAGGDDWRDRLSMTPGSKKSPPVPRKCLENVLTALLHCPDWQNVLRHNEFADRTEIAKALPRAPNHEGGSELGALRDGHVLWAIAWFHEQLGFEPSVDMMHRAMVEVARTNPFHPVRDWLRSLQWDRRPRCDRMLATLFGAEDNEVNRAIGSKWMISAVARVMRPGCQVDHMMVLEGPQGARKSTALRTLVGEDWFRNSPIDLRSKDAPMTLKGAWVYEFDELDAFRGRDATRIKSFLTLRVDSYRPSYGREVVDVPRQVAFVGSTNEDRYLADPTGNRRFWPVRCGVIDIPGLLAARDQLWAEAFARYASSELWHVESAGLIEQFKAAQSEREELDAWQEPIAAWWEGLHDDRKRDGITTADIAGSVLDLRLGTVERRDEMRIGAILRKLGLSRKKMRVRGGLCWRYVPEAGTDGGQAA